MKNSCLYREIADMLAHKITSGELPAGVNLPSVSELRKNYPVSHVTVLRAYRHLADKGMVIHQPHQPWRVSQLYLERQRKQKMIGCLLSSLSIQSGSNYFNRITAGIQLEAGGAECSLLLAPRSSLLLAQTQTCLSSPILVDEALAQAPLVSGFLLDSRVADSVVAQILEETGKRIVILDRTSGLPVDCVVPEIRDVHSRLFTLLRKLGYEAFVACTGSQDWKSREREMFFLELSSRYPVEIIQNFQFHSFAEIDHLLMKAVNSFSGRRTAVFAFSDGYAENIIRILLRHGLKVPEDLGVIGNLGDQITNQNRKITTLQIHPEELGRIAVRCLLIPDFPREFHYVHPEFVLGETT